MNYKKIIKYRKILNILNERIIIKKINKIYMIRGASDIINIDSPPSHIKGYIQNLILAYTPDLFFDINNYQHEYPRIIASDASWLHANTQNTQSSIWCPLIFNALKHSGHAIPDEWTKYHNTAKFDKFEEYSKKLSDVPFWDQYAAYILMKYKGPVFKNDSDDPELNKFAREIEKKIYDEFNL